MKNSRGAPSIRAREDGLFFERLSQWGGAAESAAYFDRHAAQDVVFAKPDLYRHLFRELIDHLRTWYDVPRRYSWTVREWHPVYQLQDETDLNYFTDATAIKAVEGVLGVGDPRAQEIAGVINLYFKLVRTGFPGNFPKPFLTTQDCVQWISIFPEHLAWQSVGVVRRVGIASKIAQFGYRAFMRFIEGVFEPPMQRHHVHRWLAACWGAPYWLRPGEEADFGAHRANLVASRFANGFQTNGSEGICGDVPRCGECPLSGDCAWYSLATGHQGSPNESLALAAQGRADGMAPTRLLQGLLGLDEEKHQGLRGRLHGHSLRELGRMNITELRNLLGPQKGLAEHLALAFELCRRFNEDRMLIGERFETPWDVYKHFHMRLRDLKQEQFIVMLLDNHRRYIGDDLVSQGTLTASPVHPRDVFSRAVRAGAASIIVVHNHPSGEPEPSKADLDLTRLLRNAGELMGIPVLDHVIIGNDKYFSLVDHGLLDH